MPNYNSTLQTNNSSLEEIITQLNNMPDAGGSSTSIETCTVELTAYTGYDTLYATILNDEGVIDVYYLTNFTSLTLNNVLCNSLLTYSSANDIMPEFTNANRINNNHFQITAPAGGTATIFIHPV